MGTPFLFTDGSTFTMSKYKDLVKGGWHPEKSRGTEKKGIRGQVSGLVRGNKDDPSTKAQNHVSVPITSLKDPSSFAPPPKRTANGALPPPPPRSTETRQVVAAPSKYQDPRGPPAAPPPKTSAEQSQLEYYQQYGISQQEEVAEEEEEKPRGPYRTNTTGLSVDHLPKPPGRRDGADGRGPPALEASTSARQSPSLPARSSPALPSRQPAAIMPPPSAKPGLPPRLPARTNSAATSSSQESEPSGGLLNEGAVNRLGAAGVNVPGLGIRGQQASPSPPPPPRQSAASVNELQNRFSKLRTTQSQTQDPPSEGTTWAQKQQALNTASNFQKDPSSISMSDARSAAGTANNFRQRHGAQIASGAKTANNLDQRFGVSSRLGGFARGQQAQPEESEPAPAPAPAPAHAPQLLPTRPVPSSPQETQPALLPSQPLKAVAAAKKKPPPPPPKKKPGLAALPAATQVGTDDDQPPPIPMSTRPTF